MQTRFCDDSISTPMHNAKCTTIGLLGQTLILAQGPFEDYWTFNIKNFLGVIFVFSCKKYKLPVRTSVIVNQLTREGVTTKPGIYILQNFILHRYITLDY